jgi:hypothetical protein
MSDPLPSAQQRRDVARRAGRCCEYCLCPEAYGLQSFECEHIVPLSHGGTSQLENLAWACGGCNRFKAARTHATDPESGESVILYHPRRHRWGDHFVWGADFSTLFGLTAIGRATIEALRLNRPGVVNLRQLLLLVQKHPPSM